MRVLVVVLAVVCLVAPASSALAWPRSVGKMQGCTIWAVRHDLLATASHCVLSVGTEEEVAYPSGAGWRWHTATVVWDGLTQEGEWKPDIALLRPSLPWPEYLYIARFIPNDVSCVTLSHPMGLERLRGTCILYGLRQDDGSWWIVWYGNLVGRGSSGGPVLVGGQVVGLIVGGDPEFRLYRGAPAGDIARAVRDYDRSR